MFFNWGTDLTARAMICDTPTQKFRTLDICPAIFTQISLDSTAQNLNARDQARIFFPGLRGSNREPNQALELKLNFVFSHTSWVFAGDIFNHNITAQKSATD
ncbi:MAG TPA: hypothetical protein PKD54_00270 [Pirellulaceae bacterium]|nr:hypothetical protein [Pirellulaceae bacterium]